MLGASRLDLVKYETLEVYLHLAVTFYGTLAPPASLECGLVKEGHVGLGVLWDGFPELRPGARTAGLLQMTHPALSPLQLAAKEATSNTPLTRNAAANLNKVELLLLADGAFL
jgi:hypothetical protein